MHLSAGRNLTTLGRAIIECIDVVDEQLDANPHTLHFELLGVRLGFTETESGCEAPRDSDVHL